MNNDPSSCHPSAAQLSSDLSRDNWNEMDEEGEIKRKSLNLMSFSPSGEKVIFFIFVILSTFRLL